MHTWSYIVCLTFYEKGGDGIMGTEELLTTEQVAEVLHMKPATVARKVNAGEIRGIKIGKRWLVPRQTLEEMIRSSAPQG